MPKSCESLRLSIVVTARNDDHGGNFLSRMQTFLTSFLLQAEAFKLHAELIIVEWNPPADRPRLREVLQWPLETQYCRVRIIEVGESLHRRFRYSQEIPLFQMIAKNAGIRRAVGKFILATNVDILFTNEWVRFLTEKDLQPTVLYRMNRLDVPLEVSSKPLIALRLTFCHENKVRINARSGTFSIRPFYRRWHLPDEGLEWLSKGLYQWENFCHRWKSKASRQYWIHKLVEFKELMTWFCPDEKKRKKISAWIKEMRDLPALGRCWILKLKKIRRKLKLQGMKKLHTNACGDFTLLSREGWHRLRGYPELEMFSIHLDSVFCQMAHYAGMKEVVLKAPCRMYHMDHHSGWNPDQIAGVIDTMKKKEVPMLENDQYTAWVEQMYEQKSPLVFNEENWGLADYALKETVYFNGVFRELKSSEPLPAQRFEAS